MKETPKLHAKLPAENIKPLDYVIMGGNLYQMRGNGNEKLTAYLMARGGKPMTIKYTKPSELNKVGFMDDSPYSQGDFL